MLIKQEERSYRDDYAKSVVGETPCVGFYLQSVGSFHAAADPHKEVPCAIKAEGRDAPIERRETNESTSKVQHHR